MGRNEHFNPASRINNKEPPIRFNQTNTRRVLPTKNNPVILFVSDVEVIEWGDKKDACEAAR